MLGVHCIAFTGRMRRSGVCHAMFRHLVQRKHPLCLDSTAVGALGTMKESPRPSMRAKIFVSQRVDDDCGDLSRLIRDSLTAVPTAAVRPPAGCLWAPTPHLNRLASRWIDLAINAYRLSALLLPR